MSHFAKAGLRINENTFQPIPPKPDLGTMRKHAEILAGVVMLSS
jgi:hypothetical protein